ncbi:hypothetical protein [Methylobacterium sp. 092160098-2]|uniref:hypothetical protein n=1 Tax=Methylobacterium sp. 092160098-2 TaxID=3025129 RepID=UPI002381A82C|nr:hypothetical protein [Methylobacterium sp. 092160098-2]MDE4914880.1 hypothetical protein [Methylobacterium sp. 092160098-2]
MPRRPLLTIAFALVLGGSAPALADGALYFMRGVPSFGSNLQVGGHGETAIDIGGGEGVQIEFQNAPSWLTVAEIQEVGPGRARAILHADPTEFGQFDGIVVRVTDARGRSASSIPFRVQVLPPSRR